MKKYTKRIKIMYKINICGIISVYHVEAAYIRYRLQNAKERLFLTACG